MEVPSTTFLTSSKPPAPQSTKQRSAKKDEVKYGTNYRYSTILKKALELQMIIPTGDTHAGYFGTAC